MNNMPEPYELMERQSGADSKFFICNRCAAQLHRESRLYEADEMYSIDGYILCPECFEEYTKNKFRIGA